MPRVAPPEEGMEVEINHRPVFSTTEGFNARKVTVCDVLAEQFTVEVDGVKRFYFFKDHGNSWRYPE
jgi:hypothetical protein